MAGISLGCIRQAGTHGPARDITTYQHDKVCDPAHVLRFGQVYMFLQI